MTVYGQATPASIVSLPRYAERINYQECAFFGVAHPTNIEYACREIWTKYERDMVAQALTEAQNTLEEYLNFRIGKYWTVAEQHPYSSPIITRWKNVVSGGVRAVSNVSLNKSVTLTADPTVTTVSTALTDLSEIHIFHVGTDLEIIPSALSVSAGTLTITIPKCRLVAPAYMDNPRTGLDYYNNALFQSKIDVKRIYNDSSSQVTLVSPCSCGNPNACICGESTKTGCAYFSNPRLGIATVSSATYAGGSWSRSSAGCSDNSIARISYLSGVVLDFNLETMITRLANTLLPEEPCGCDAIQRLWRKDRFIPNILSVERLNCPFGLSEGAWDAFMKASAMRVYSGGETY